MGHKRLKNHKTKPPPSFAPSAPPCGHSSASAPVKLLLISPEDHDERELPALSRLFAAGLSHYHLRKPTWDRARLAAHLRAIPAEFHPRIILHLHHDLAADFRLGGLHTREGATPSPHAFTSRVCHDLASLRAAFGSVSRILVSPIYPSLSKPGHHPPPTLSHATIAAALSTRTPIQCRTEVVALGGIDATRLPAVGALGFDAAALLGAVWLQPDPVAAFVELQAIASAMPVTRTPLLATSPLMCLTQDELPITHAAQARALLAAGARWIQLRMKNAAPADWLATAREVVAACRAAGAACIVNDSIDIALGADAHGVHLGKLDGDWSAARARLGPDRILGGTVNDADAARRAAASGVLDYVGIGPWRFTTTKKNLAPVLGPEGIAPLLPLLGDLPAWVIGGIRPDDLAAIRALGARGVAVSSALVSANDIPARHAAFLAAWSAHPCPSV